MVKSKLRKPERESPPRVSDLEELILSMLVGAQREQYGLQMVGQSEGRLKRGTVYVTLQRMEEKGLVESREENQTSGYVGIPRRLYKPTGLGESALRAKVMVRAYMAGGNPRLAR